MTALLLNRLSVIWAGLILATGLSWQFGHGFGFGDDIQYAAVAILVITFIKIRFVFLDFMEIRTAPLALRLVLEVWAVLACVIRIGLYWMGL